MNSLPLQWTLYIPLIGGFVATLIAMSRQLRGVPASSAPLLRLLSLLIGCVTLLIEAGVIARTTDDQTATLFGIAFAISAPARYVLTAANVALLCALINGWLTVNEDTDKESSDPWRVAVVCSTSTLLAGAALSTDRLVTALLLFAAALPVAAAVFALTDHNPAQPADFSLSDDEQTAHVTAEQATARRLTGAFKQVALALLATVLWIAGSTLIDRYGFNLEDAGLLQFGVALLAVGLLVRAGTMPFASAWADTIETTPSWAILLMGACAPVALIAGMLMLAPIEGGLARGAAAGWLGAVGALLAGVRALGTLRSTKQARISPTGQPRRENITTIKAMTVAVAVAWALYGVLSGSQAGAVGALMIATNIALAVPLLILGGRWISLIAAASLLGLPPLGGFSGMLLVAGSAADTGGLWLGLLLLGSALVASTWLSTIFKPDAADPDPLPGWRSRLTDPLLLLSLILVLTQVALFVLSNSRLTTLQDWATVPWLTAP